MSYSPDWREGKLRAYCARAGSGPSLPARGTGKRATEGKAVSFHNALSLFFNQL